MIFEVLFEILFLGIINYNNEEFFVVPEEMYIYIEVANSLNEVLFNRLKSVINLGEEVKLITLKGIKNRIDYKNKDLNFHRVLYHLYGLRFHAQNQ